jgi:hypothetical protein
VSFNEEQILRFAQDDNLIFLVVLAAPCAASALLHRSP